MFLLNFDKKYIKSLVFLRKYNFHNVLNKVQQIEEILENGSWLQPNVKNQFINREIDRI